MRAATAMRRTALIRSIGLADSLRTTAVASAMALPNSSANSSCSWPGLAVVPE